jgi:hypothetical protein
MVIKTINNLIMKKSFLFIVALITMSTTSFAQELGLGFQASFPSYGLSLKADLTETHTVQGVFGAFGTVTMISGRYIYNFSETGDSFPITPFVYAQAGQWNYNEDLLGIDESVFGYGVGAGIEFNWLNFFSDRFRTTLELGYSKVDLEFFDFSATTIGVGLHYNFLEL